ncbi:MAG: hypothetical protein LBG92_01990 [Prevotellaceae bacterium]|jgi:hypothetical protein|nr:hypothetical protein [Prevotellaceae bacterium]
MDKNLSPVILFVYNRPKHTVQTVEALQNNTLAKKSELFIFSDAPKDRSAVEAVAEVRKYVRKISGFKTVHLEERAANMGCDASIIDGVSGVIAEYGKAIGVEDDILTAPLFLEYMNCALDTFEGDGRIWSVSAFTPRIKIPSNYRDSIYLSYRLSSWGWGTWKNRWESIDWNKTGYEKALTDKAVMRDFCRAGEDLLCTLRKYPEAWDITSYYSQWKKNQYSVYPVVSLVKNTGLGKNNNPTHHGFSRKYSVKLHNRKLDVNPQVQPDKKILQRTKQFYSKKWYRKFMVFVAKKMGIYDFLYRNLL